MISDNSVRSSLHSHENKDFSVRTANVGSDGLFYIFQL